MGRPEIMRPGGRVGPAALSVLALVLVSSACTASSPDPSELGAASAPAPSDERVSDGDEVHEEEADGGAATGPGEPDQLSFQGPPDGAVLGAEERSSLSFVVSSGNRSGSRALQDLRIHLDGDDVTGAAEASRGRLVYAPVELEDGAHRVEVVVGATGTSAGAEPGTEPGRVVKRWRFRVDASAPEIEVEAPERAVVAGDPLTLQGVTEAGAVVSTAAATAQAGSSGKFSIEVQDVREGPLELVVSDEAGNLGKTSVEILTVPSRVEVDEIRAVHVSFCAWVTPSLREPVLDLVEDGSVTAIQLDLKDESGMVGFENEIELSDRIGSDEASCPIDLDAAVQELHELGVPVIGRIVAFADPVLAPWAWENDQRDWVLQTAGGEMYTGGYDGFSNPAAPEVVEYNLDIAEAAAAAGVDHILWDYVRKPDGAPGALRFPGLEGEPAEAVAEFTQLADERLAPYGVQHGASVYGISADRPGEVAQDIPAMSEHLDYVAPMLYPSHWGAGEYGVADPLHEPYDIITATLEVWEEATEGRRARVVPWLEDSEWPVMLGYPDRGEYVREQIRATYDRGIHEWLLWDSAVDYTSAAIAAPPDE